MPVIRRRPLATQSLNARPTQNTAKGGQGYLAVGRAEVAAARAEGQATNYQANQVKASMSLVNAATGVARSYQQEQEKADDFTFKIAATEFEGGQQRAYNQSLASLSGDGNHWRNERLQAFDKDGASFLKGLPQSQQQRGQLFIAQKRNEIDNRSFGEMQRYRQVWALNKTRSVIESSLLPGVSGDVAENTPLMTQIDKLIAGARIARPDIKERLRETAVDQAYKAWRTAAGINVYDESRAIIGTLEDGQGLPTDSSIYSRFVRRLAGEEQNLKRYSLEQERAAERREAQRDRAIQQQTTREGLELFYQGQLTQDWVETNAGSLSNSAYSRFMGAIIKHEAWRTDPHTYVDLIERAPDSPKEIMTEAIEAFKARQLSKADFNKIYTMARAAERSENKLPIWAKEQRSLLKSQLRPSKEATDAERKAYSDALERFDTYVSEQGGKLDRKELRTWSEDLIKANQTETIGKARRTLDLPKHAQVGRDAMTLEIANLAATRLVQDLKVGTITRAEAAKQWALIKQWKKVLEPDAKTQSIKRENK